MKKIFGTKQLAKAEFGSTIELGAYGERLAIDHIKKQGYRIVATNYTAPLGLSRNGRIITGEIDIIAYDADGILCFIEVKTRSSQEFAAPQTAVDRRKQRQIIRTSRIYRRVLQLGGEAFRFDVVSVLLASATPEVTILQSYFSEARFEHSNWLRGY
ncbi:MAG: YraN family protein [Acidobacteria bacterium]|nr:YraN family protein [Acidobacteriota bacterium]